MTSQLEAWKQNYLITMIFVLIYAMISVGCFYYVSTDKEFSVLHFIFMPIGYVFAGYALGALFMAWRMKRKYLSKPV